MPYRVELTNQPQAIYDRAMDYLMRNETVHNLPIGLLTLSIQNPDVYEDFRFALVLDANDAMVGFAMQTLPFPIVTMSQFTDLDAVEPLATELAALDGMMGAGGVLDVMAHFGPAFQAITGRKFRMAMPQWIYRVDELIMPTGIPGHMRDVTPDDRDLLIEWWMGFQTDALHIPPNRTGAEKAVERIYNPNEPARAAKIWEVDGVAVSVCASGGDSPNGARVGPVYTPPDQRRKGYAAAITAAFTQWLMTERERQFVILYTDADNPTSNGVYQRIGYYQVAQAAELAFDAP